MPYQSANPHKRNGIGLEPIYVIEVSLTFTITVKTKQGTSNKSVCGCEFWSSEVTFIFTTAKKTLVGISDKGNFSALPTELLLPRGQQVGLEPTASPLPVEVTIIYATPKNFIEEQTD